MHEKKRIIIRSLAALIITAAAVAGLLYFDMGAYPWVKSVHIIAVISWMAGMLYLPRLFVYHCAVAADKAQSAIFKIMEQRLLRYIINPSMIVVWVTGLWLAWRLDYFHDGWLHLKLTAVILLSGFHGFLTGSVRRFAKDENKYSAKTWRILNEAPTILMIIAVIAVIVRPF